jgi:hypothetical protein
LPYASSGGMIVLTICPCTKERMKQNRNRNKKLCQKDKDVSKATTPSNDAWGISKIHVWILFLLFVLFNRQGSNANLRDSFWALSFPNLVPHGLHPIQIQRVDHVHDWNQIWTRPKREMPRSGHDKFVL